VHHPSVYTLLPSQLINREIQCVGRLDQDTTGLLLLTDDGQFIHRMASPKYQVPKEYIATLKHPIEAELIEQLLAGVVLHDDPEPVAATSCEVLSPHQLKLTITSGRYHQVKRMLAAGSNRVEALHRSAVGNLLLPDDLAPGEWRWLDCANLPV
jgi:16S rRNA pseudouridine516 synthase